MKNKKIALVVLLLFFFSLSTTLIYPQTQPKAWYVYKNATGLNNGTSWQNAWTSFSAINWNAIQQGDSIYISGGTDSVVYNETLTVTKSNITISRSNDTGHNGKVIIDGQNTRLYCILNQASYHNTVIDGIDRTKLIVRNFLDQGIRFRYNSNNTIRNFTVELNNPNAFSGIFLFGPEWQNPPSFSGPYLVENFIIWQDSGNYPGSGNSDGIQAGGVDGVTIRNGLIILQNSNDNPHQDGVQMYHCKNIIVENLRIYHYNAGSTNAKQGIYITNSGGKIKIRNNYVYKAQNAWGSSIAIEQYQYDWWTIHTPPDSFIISNNTVESTGSRDHALRLVQGISVSNEFTGGNTIVMNNIFKTAGAVAIDRKFFSSPSNCNYNIYVTGTNTINDAINSSSGTSRTLSAWQSFGFDLNSTMGVDPLLQTQSYILNSGSPAINAGINLLNFGYNKDIVGTTRPQGGTWDIGAYEFIQGQNNDFTPPQVVIATLLDSGTLNIIFSEPLEQSGANNPANYQIDNGIQINNAQLIGNSVRLQTSPHIPGFYSITVNNVSDTAGNVISPQHNSAIYGYNPDPLPGILKFTPARSLASSVPEPEHLPEKTFDGLGYNSGDPSSRWAANGLPQWIVYDLGNIKMLNKTRIQFFRWLEGRIYTYSILSSVDSVNWITLRQNIVSQSVEWNEENFEPTPARYVKISITGNNENDWADVWETEIYGQLMVSNLEEDKIKKVPQEFVLDQNYPNPFNPSTKISWQMPVGSHQTLKVYDILGNEVATLVDEYKEPGRYEIEFDASNLTSGVYLYKLSSGIYTQIKKMILIK